MPKRKTPEMPNLLRVTMDFMEAFQWTRKGLARAWEYPSDNTIRQKLAGKTRITEDEADWMAKVRAFFAANPPPVRGFYARSGKAGASSPRQGVAARREQASGA